MFAEPEYLFCLMKIFVCFKELAAIFVTTLTETAHPFNIYSKLYEKPRRAFYLLGHCFSLFI